MNSNDKTTNKDDACKNTSSTAVIQGDNTSPTQEPTAQQFEKVEQRMTDFERSTVRLTMAATIIATIAAVFVCLQWYEMHSGGVDTKALADAAGKQAEAANTLAEQAKAQTGKMDESLKLTGQAVNAATISAKAAKVSVEVTRTIMKVDKRAWIGLDYITPDPLILEVGKTFGYKAGIINTGKTPALNLRIYSIIEPVDEGKRPNFSYVGIHPIIGGFLPPNGKAALPLNVLINVRRPEKPSAIIEQWQLDLFKSKKFNIYSHGRIEYEDIFGDHHWMTYCSYLPYPSISSFAFCPEHNENDDYKEVKK